MDLALLLVILGIVALVLGYTAVLPAIFVTLGWIALVVGIVLYLVPVFRSYSSRPPR